jgi:hypothetical protein
VGTSTYAPDAAELIDNQATVTVNHCGAGNLSESF